MTRFAVATIRLPASGSYPVSRGFSLIEMAVSLVVIGLLVSGSAAYLGLFKSGTQLGADAQLTSLSESTIVFARTHHRLPCPDTEGSGYEALDASGVCQPGTQVGWLPYLSMGLSQPSAKDRVIYGVYRNPAADLAASTAPAVVSLASAQAVSNNYVYVTGDGTTANGLENCTTNIASNPAFVILAPGEDRNGDGLLVDGIHGTLPITGRCFAAPTRGADTHFDDRTLAVSTYALMARIS